MCYNIDRKRENKGDKKMAKQEILNKIDELATKRMYLACKDRWTKADFDRDDEMAREQRALKEMLKNF